MPELIEVELYRGELDELVGRTLTEITVNDTNYLRPKGRPVVDLDALIGLELIGTRRRGKLLLADFADAGREATLGLRFGMTGRLLVNGVGPIDRLEYASPRNDARWDRFTAAFGRDRMAIRDPRRLGSVELEPDEETLGPDAATLEAAHLAAALRNRRASVKAVLLDQQRVAGLGNLLADEILWRASLDPSVAGGAVEDVDALCSTIVATVALLTRRGGSHTGDTFDQRHTGGHCPHDGAPMVHGEVGGRSTWWCSSHQGRDVKQLDFGS